MVPAREAQPSRLPHQPLVEWTVDCIRERRAKRHGAQPRRHGANVEGRVGVGATDPRKTRPGSERTAGKRVKQQHRADRAKPLAPESMLRLRCERKKRAVIEHVKAPHVAGFLVG
eukprot:7283644-Prymnesium_polylepis.1